MIRDITVVVDLTGCEHIGKIQPRIKETFDFEDGYGHNWSAFRDFLFWEYPVTKVVVKGSSTLKPTWMFKKDLEIFREILEDRKKYCESDGTVFDYEFE